jgi:site-specific DNA recombinase
VAARLDPDRLYGIWWYNRRQVQRTRVLQDNPDGERRYVTRTRYADKPREEWIAVPVPDAGVPKEVVDRARDVLRDNEKCSGAGRRFWELSGGIFRCAECGRALVATTTLKGAKNYRRRMFYYQCATRRQVGKHACSFSRSINAKKAEAAVWDAISTLLTSPKSLRRDLEAMIEREKETRGDPKPEAKAWAATLSEVERKRDKYQEMFTADAITLDELRSKLNSLEETRETARRELTALASWNESLEAFERDKDKLLESYATLAPEALAALDPEEHRTVYSMLGLCVEALPDKSLRVRGAFGEESLVCHHERTSTR